MKPMCGTVFGFLLTATAYGGPLDLCWDCPPPESPIEEARTCATVLEHAFPPAELVQAVQLALLRVPAHDRNEGGGCIPRPDPYDDALQATRAALAGLIHSSERVRVQSIQRLREHAFRLEVEALVALVTNDPSPTVREAAAKSLGLVARGSSVALQALRRSAKEDKDPEVRRTALFAAEILQTPIKREDEPCDPLEGFGCTPIF
jgi:hypothetical protein